MIFPPKEATQMSHDVKYIGMDVHKEATVIAVLNERRTMWGGWGGVDFTGRS
jgi:hypothetical protein